MKLSNSWGPATVLMMVIAVVVLGVGGAVVIADNMTFHDYLEQLKWFAGGVGLLAVGRGIYASNNK